MELITSQDLRIVEDSVQLYQLDYLLTMPLILLALYILSYIMFPNCKLKFLSPADNSKMLFETDIYRLVEVFAGKKALRFGLASSVLGSSVN